MQEKYSKLDRQGNLLNISSNSAISGGKKSHPSRKILFSSKCSLKSHFDCIRGLHFLPTLNALASASEDCTLKIWDVGKFYSLKEIEGIANFEPYISIRGNSAPIVCLTGVQQCSNQLTDNLLLTGTSKGVIKAWKAPHPS